MGDKIKVIMDCDPGIDDGIALAYAAAHQDELELLAVTTSAGSTRIERVTKNALELVDFYGLKVPVAGGQDRPLVKAAIVCCRKQNQRLLLIMQCFLSVTF